MSAKSLLSITGNERHKGSMASSGMMFVQALMIQNPLVLERHTGVMIAEAYVSL
jgi:hypothetical protein